MLRDGSGPSPWHLSPLQILPIPLQSCQSPEFSTNPTEIPEGGTPGACSMPLRGVCLVPNPTRRMTLGVEPPRVQRSGHSALVLIPPHSIPTAKEWGGGSFPSSAPTGILLLVSVLKIALECGHQGRLCLAWVFGWLERRSGTGPNPSSLFTGSQLAQPCPPPNRMNLRHSGTQSCNEISHGLFSGVRAPLPEVQPSSQLGTSKPVSPRTIDFQEFMWAGWRLGYPPPGNVSP